MIITSIRESQLYSRHLARHINVPSDFRYYINSFENVNYYFGSEYKFHTIICNIHPHRNRVCCLFQSS